MKKYEKHTILEWANYIVENHCSVNKTAAHFNVPDQTVWYHMNKLRKEDTELGRALAEIIEFYKTNKFTANESTDAEITVSNSTTVTASGTRRGGNCHPIICIDTGAIYTSSLDAAEILGIEQANLSRVVSGHGNRVKGLRFCKVSEASERIGVIAKVISEKNAKCVELTARNTELTTQNSNIAEKYNALLEKQKAREAEKAKLVELETKRQELLAELANVDASIEETKNKLLEV